MSRKQISKEQFDNLAASNKQPIFQLTVYWYANQPSRAHVTSVLSALIAGEFFMSLDRSKEFYTVLFFDSRCVQQLNECPSIEWTEPRIGRVDIKDLTFLTE
jgi:hypothetical protein